MTVWIVRSDEAHEGGDYHVRIEGVFANRALAEQFVSKQGDPRFISYEIEEHTVVGEATKVLPA